MGARKQHTTQPGDTALMDAAFDAYLGWREACVTVWDAYERWRGAETRQTGATFWAYQAALEREEQAARTYARLVGQIEAAAAAAVGSAPRGIPLSGATG